MRTTTHYNTMQNETTSNLGASVAEATPAQLQTFRVAVDQAAVLRKGLAAPRSTVEIELDLNLLTSAEHEWLAARFWAGEIRRNPSSNEMLSVNGYTQDDLAAAVSETCEADALKAQQEMAERLQKEEQCLELVKVYKSDDLFAKFISRESGSRHIRRVDGVLSSTASSEDAKVIGWYTYTTPPYPPIVLGSRVQEEASAQFRAVCDRLQDEVYRLNEQEFGAIVDAHQAKLDAEVKAAEEEALRVHEERLEIINLHGSVAQKTGLAFGLTDVVKVSQQLLNHEVLGKFFPEDAFPRHIKPGVSEVTAHACRHWHVRNPSTMELRYRAGKPKCLTTEQMEVVMRLQQRLLDHGPSDVKITMRATGIRLCDAPADWREFIQCFVQLTKPHGRLRAVLHIQLPDNPDASSEDIIPFNS